jgi:hypothetical protein
VPLEPSATKPMGLITDIRRYPLILMVSSFYTISEIATIGRILNGRPHGLSNRNYHASAHGGSEASAST